MPASFVVYYSIHQSPTRFPVLSQINKFKKSLIPPLESQFQYCLPIYAKAAQIFISYVFIYS